MTTTAAGGNGRASLDGLLLGGGTFTRMPMPPPRVVDDASGRVALLSAPAWGALLGAISGAVAGGMWWWFTRGDAAPVAAAGLCAVVGVTLLAWLSRGLHLDGLADTFDGFASMRSGPAALAVMRDPQVGALGAAGLVLVLLLQVSALSVVISSLTPAGVVAVLAAVGLLSRGLLPWAARAGTPVAGAGLGSAVVGRVSTLQGALVLVGAGSPAVLMLMWAGVAPIAALLAAVAAVIGVGVLRRSASRRFGAVTGDVLGAMVETAATCMLVVSALAV